MNIIDEFLLKFTSNAKEVERDVDSAGKAADKFEERLSKGGHATRKAFAESQKATKEFHEELKKTDKTTADLGLSFTRLATAGVGALTAFSAFGKLKDGLVSALDYNATIEKTAKLTGINARQLSLWNDVVARAGGNPGGKEYLDFITKLNQQYAGLGINERTKRVNEDLLKYADMFAEMERRNPGSSQSLASKIGIGPDLWLALKPGREAVLAMLDAMGKLDNTTEATANAAFVFKQKWIDLGIVLRSAVTASDPTLRAVEWTLEHILKLISAIGGAGNEYFGRMFDVVSFIGSFRPGGGWGGLAPSTAPAAGKGAQGTGNQSQALSLISQYESGGRNVPNAMGPGGSPASTASGYYQITNGTWRDFAPKAGVSLAQYPTAMSAPYDVQTKVASIIYEQRGLEPWSSDARLLAAMGKTNIAQADSASLPTSSVSNQKSLSVGSVTVNTQATDAKGVANGFWDGVADLFDSVNDGGAF